MTMLGYYERAGTNSSEFLFVRHGDVAYAGGGNDLISLDPGSHAYLIGGSGDDVYELGISSYGVVLDSHGYDTIVAPFNISPASTFAVTVDGGRHLLIADISTETMVLVMDSHAHPIEAFSFNGFVLSRQGMESVIQGNGMHMGDLSYGQVADLGFGNESFWSIGMQAEINYILEREGYLFAPDPDSNPEVIPVPGPVASTISFVDTDWYLSQNPDVAAAGVDATNHYMNWGWKEGRDPNTLFDTDWYLTVYQDVAAAGINPLEHYMLYGWQEGRDPSASFDTTYYLDTHSDVALAGINPLTHYLNWGLMEGREIAAVG